MKHLPLLILLLSACASPDTDALRLPDTPYVVVLGTAQDAGLPQIGCNDACCVAARKDPSRQRLVTSLMIADPRDGRRWLVEATPEQHNELARFAALDHRTWNHPVVSGVLLLVRNDREAACYRLPRSEER